MALTRGHLVGGTVAVTAAALGGLVAAWWRNDWSLDAAAMIGDAVGPLVGIASLAAVVAALVSVAHQADANALQGRVLESQEQEIQSQRDAFAQEIKLQQEGLELQRKAFEAEALNRRRDTLAQLYAPLIVAHHEWLSRVDDFLAKAPFIIEADHPGREPFIRQVLEAHAAVERAQAPVGLLDPSRGWQTHRACSNIQLRPLVDTKTNWNDWMIVIGEKRVDRQEKMIEVQRQIRRELGVEIEREETDDSRARDAEMAELREETRRRRRRSRSESSPSTASCGDRTADCLDSDGLLRTGS
jgi:hypothetical protein